MDLLKHSMKLLKIQNLKIIEIQPEDENIQTSIFSTLMTEALGALTNSENSLKIIQDDLGRASILGTPIFTLSDDRMRIKGNVYVLFPEIYKTLSSTSFTGKTMKNEKDFLLMKIIIGD